MVTRSEHEKAELEAWSVQETEDDKLIENNQI